MTIPVTLFRDLKLSDNHLVTADVDNNLYFWDHLTLENNLRTLTRLDIDNTDGKFKDFFIDPRHEEVAFVSVEEVKRDTTISIDRLSGSELKSILKHGRFERDSNSQSPYVEKHYKSTAYPGGSQIIYEETNLASDQTR